MHDHKLSDPYDDPRERPIAAPKSAEKPRSLKELRDCLQKVRRESLFAVKAGNFRKVAKLTAEAADLNKAIITHPEAGLQ